MQQQFHVRREIIVHNQKIRAEAKEYRVKLWQIAEKLGVNDGNFSRKLRRELPEQEQSRIIEIIHSIANEAAQMSDKTR